MIRNIQKQRTTFLYRIFSAFIAMTFIAGSVVPPTPVYAQTPILNLPIPGTMVPISPVYTPTMIKGILIDPAKPLQFDFIMDTGNAELEGEAFNEEATKLIKYFLASLTLKEEDMWVNLSPYEKDRIIPDSFGQTEMGRDLLAQDYLLKQLTASLMYPEDELGKKFWDKIYAKAREEFGTTEIPVDTFNKVWIVPDSANVFEHEKGAYVVDSHLRVLLEEDYLAGSYQSSAVSRQKSSAFSHQLSDNSHQNSELLTNPNSSIQLKTEDRRLTAQSKPLTTEDRRLTTNIIREIILPEIEKEVNQGATFANLRQIYHSMILATWYKQNLKESLLSKVYVNKNRIKGVDQEDPAVNQQIYDQYIDAFKKGVYNYIKEDVDPTTNEIIPRKYFSGGASVKELPGVVENGTTSSPLSPETLAHDGNVITVNLDPHGHGANDLLAAAESSSPVKPTTIPGVIVGHNLTPEVDLGSRTAQGLAGSSPVKIVPLNARLSSDEYPQLFSGDWARSEPVQRRINHHLDHPEKFDPDLSFAAVNKDGLAVGFIMGAELKEGDILYRENTLYVSKGVIHPDYQGSSVLAKLLLKVLVAAESRGFTHATWKTRVDPDPSLKGTQRALPLYESLGELDVERFEDGIMLKAIDGTADKKVFILDLRKARDRFRKVIAKLNAQELLVFKSQGPEASSPLADEALIDGARGPGPGSLDGYRSQGAGDKPSGIYSKDTYTERDFEQGEESSRSTSSPAKPKPGELLDENIEGLEGIELIKTLVTFLKRRRNRGRYAKYELEFDTILKFLADEDAPHYITRDGLTVNTIKTFLNEPESKLTTGVLMLDKIIYIRSKNDELIIMSRHSMTNALTIALNNVRRAHVQLDQAAGAVQIDSGLASAVDLSQNTINKFDHFMASFSRLNNENKYDFHQALSEIHDQIENLSSESEDRWRLLDRDAVQSLFYNASMIIIPVLAGIENFDDSPPGGSSGTAKGEKRSKHSAHILPFPKGGNNDDPQNLLDNDPETLGDIKIKSASSPASPRSEILSDPFRPRPPRQAEGETGSEASETASASAAEGGRASSPTNDGASSPVATISDNPIVNHLIELLHPDIENRAELKQAYVNFAREDHPLKIEAIQAFAPLGRDGIKQKTQDYLNTAPTTKNGFWGALRAPVERDLLKGRALTTHSLILNPFEGSGLDYAQLFGHHMLHRKTIEMNKDADFTRPIVLGNYLILYDLLDMSRDPQLVLFREEDLDEEQGVFTNELIRNKHIVREAHATRLLSWSKFMIDPETERAGNQHQAKSLRNLVRLIDRLQQIDQWRASFETNANREKIAKIRAAASSPIQGDEIPILELMGVGETGPESAHASSKGHAQARFEQMSTIWTLEAAQPEVLIIGGVMHEVDFLDRKYPRARITVVNTDRNALKKIREQVSSRPDLAQRLTLAHADARYLDEYGEDRFADARYDLIYASNMRWETFDDPYNILREIVDQEGRLLKAGGILYHPGGRGQGNVPTWFEDLMAKHRLDSLQQSGQDSGFLRKSRTASSPVTSDQGSAVSGQNQASNEQRATSDEKGGIDMNPNNLDLRTQGGGFEFDMPANINLENIRIDGLTPVIINVAPLTNLPLLLGLVDDEMDDSDPRYSMLDTRNPSSIEDPGSRINSRITEIDPGRDPMVHKRKLSLLN